MRPHHIRTLAALVVGALMLSVAASMHYGASVGIAVGGFAVLVIALFLWNMPNAGDDGRRF